MTGEQSSYTSVTFTFQQTEILHYKISMCGSTTLHPSICCISNMSKELVVLIMVFVTLVAATSPKKKAALKQERMVTVSYTVPG